MVIFFFASFWVFKTLFSLVCATFLSKKKSHHFKVISWEHFFVTGTFYFQWLVIDWSVHFFSLTKKESYFLLFIFLIWRCHNELLWEVFPAFDGLAVSLLNREFLKCVYVFYLILPWSTATFMMRNALKNNGMIPFTFALLLRNEIWCQSCF